MRPGEILCARFALGAKLGHGTGGLLFEAFDRWNGNAVAIKFQHPRTFESDSYFDYSVQDLKNEAERLRALRGVRGIPDLIDEGDDHRGTHFIVMQKVDGLSVKRYAENGNSPMEVETAVCLLAQLCEILGTVHDLGYVHRDVKPENVMIDNSGAVHLVDYGSMLAVGEEGLRTGTNRYAAPEQAQDLPAATSADMFPVGCMAAEMTTLTLPYSEDYLNVMHTRSAPPEPDLTLLASHLVPVVSEMISWDPERRPRDGWAAFKRLQPFLPPKGAPRNCKVLGPDPTARYRGKSR